MIFSYMIVLSILFGTSSLSGAETTDSGAANESGNAIAKRCLAQFAKRASELRSYSARMEKTEFVRSSSGSTQNLEIVSASDRDVRLTYLDKGQTGIKNNGMTVTYNGSDLLEIKLGKARGLGVLLNGPAKLIAGNSIFLFDPSVVDEEVFTVNRAGFRYLAKVLAKKMDSVSIEDIELRGFTDKLCELSYRPRREESAVVLLKKSETIFDLEERYSTLAYLIFQANRDKFNRLSSLFKRDRDIEIRVPRSLPWFDLTIENASHLPTEFTLYSQQKRIGRYRFSSIGVKSPAVD